MASLASLTAAVADAIGEAPEARWGIVVRAESGEVLTATGADQVLHTASVGKLFLLVAAARSIVADPTFGDRRVARSAVEPVADSGVLQHLRQPDLSVWDLCVLVGTVSDNLATNLLLSVLPVPDVARLTEELGFRQSRLLDSVRDVRRPEHPPTLSVGTAAELCDFMHRLAAGTLDTPPVCALVRGWLSTGTDLSMAASAFGLDPLAHTEIDRGFVVVNKTGTNPDARIDTGFASGPGGRVSYAALAQWPLDADPAIRDRVLAAMASIGRALRAAVSAL